MERCLYAVPTVPFMHNASIADLDKNIEESRTSLMACKDAITKHEKDGETPHIPSLYLKGRIAKLAKDREESQAQADLVALIHVI